LKFWYQIVGFLDLNDLSYGEGPLNCYYGYFETKNVIVGGKRLGFGLRFDRGHATVEDKKYT